MKILHIITSLKIGGAETCLVNFLEETAIKNIENKHVVICFYGGPNVNKIKKLGFEVFCIQNFFCPYDLFFFYNILKSIRDIRPNIIHSSLWSANVISRICARIFSIPIVCDLHGNSFHEGAIRNWFEKKNNCFV